MQFLFQPLAWGFLLVLLPLLIHLINLLRHRRTHWAAMEFLLGLAQTSLAHRIENVGRRNRSCHVGPMGQWLPLAFAHQSNDDPSLCGSGRFGIHG